MIDSLYKKGLTGIGDITFQKQTEGADPNCWLFTIRTQSQAKLLALLNENKLQSRPFWVPMNQLPMFADKLYVTRNDNVGRLYKECLSIPCSTDISEEELNKVIALIQSNI